jgi:hypothetical protein
LRYKYNYYVRINNRMAYGIWLLGIVAHRLFCVRFELYKLLFQAKLGVI